DLHEQPAPTRRKLRILFYAHFPDQLMSRTEEEQGAYVRALKRLYRLPFDYFEGWAMSAADKVVSNSQFSRRTTLDVFGSKVGDVGVVYPCVDTETETETEAEAKASAPAADGKDVTRATDDAGVAALLRDTDDDEFWPRKKVLLSINRFERKKNIGLAIHAFHQLGEKGRAGARLVLAGGYDTRVAENVAYHAELDGLATRLGLRTATCRTALAALAVPDEVDVVFLLSVPALLKAALLRAARLLLYTPSHEHFGIVPVEAMWAGVPVLAVNTGGPLETVVDGETGWLRADQGAGEWTNVLRRVLWQMTDEELRQMGQRGRRRVRERFSLAAMGDALERVVDEMVAREPRPFLEMRHVVVLGKSVVVFIVAMLLVVVRSWLS
ncbi:Alpha-1,3-mannosyltransferase-like protein, partial [Ascosphaera acerosa]